MSLNGRISIWHLVSVEMQDAGIGAQELVVVHQGTAIPRKIIGTKVHSRTGFLQRHVTTIAIGLSFRGVIKTGDAVARHAREAEGVVVVLASKPFVPIEFHWQVDFVARATEFRRLVEWLQESGFVEGRLGFHQLAVDPLQGRVFTEGKGVMLRLIHGVGRIAQVGVHMADRVAHRAGDGGLPQRIFRNRVIRIIPSWVIKCPRQKRNGVVTAGTKTTGLGVAIASR